jgi:hypothetical protein
VLLNADRKSRMDTLQGVFLPSRSAAKRRGCHYAPGYLHKTVDPFATFVIDPWGYGKLDLQVDLTISSNAGEAAFHRCSQHCRIR